MSIPTGLYEQVIDVELNDVLAEMSQRQVIRGPLDVGDSHDVLARYVCGVLSEALTQVDHDRRLSQQLDLCNRIMQLLSNDELSRRQIVTGKDSVLHAILPNAPVGKTELPLRPDTPLSFSCLLTGTRLDPSLDQQLRKELETADRVDVLCSFIKWSGIRILEPALRRFTEKPGSRLRIITTSYMGATDFRAVELLRALPNTEIKVSYDTKRTRLHAKAYIFHRDSHFGAAYIGSANISNVALTSGLEWTVKVSQYETSHLWNKVAPTFETYWNDNEFETYGASDRQRLARALKQERDHIGDPTSFFFEVRPYPYQQEILDKLEADRAYHDRWRNLIVAATGTGKTVIAALDYRRFRAQRLAEGKTARLLFVAHRKEILEQSRACFRTVLRDANFGELLVGDHEPSEMQHLFASIQKYNSRSVATGTDRDYYDYVVIDETHHVAAQTLYRTLVAHVQPVILLGLTATPERGDGESILDIFDDHITADIRLPTAIDRKLLSPFQYFGVTDVVDLGQLSWRRGGYDRAELERLYLDNRDRADLVVRKVREYLLDPSLSRGLGFCAGVDHARFMAGYFNDSGIPAIYLDASSSAVERSEARDKLVKREVNFIFVVDLYNEGIDIPQIDTVLFLRPTESLTVFLQQLGRGLRLCDDKECLTVLDFIGQAHSKYNFDIRFRSLMRNTQQSVDQEIKSGSAHLPAGCSIELEKVAQQYVLDNISNALRGPGAGLVQRIQSFSNDTGHVPTLTRFLQYYELSLDDLYRRGTWTSLCARAGIRTVTADPDALVFESKLRRLAHVCGPNQLARLIHIFQSGAQSQSLDIIDQRFLFMLHVGLWGYWAPRSIGDSLSRLRANPDHTTELLELFEYQYDRLPNVAPKLNLPFVCPMELHAAYTRDEILAGIGFWTLQDRQSFREGVKYLADIRADVFFVTLNKTDRDYSPTTMYADYAINEKLFHWQSQSGTSPFSPTGRRYIHQRELGTTILLFVREYKSRNGLAQPYVFLGPASYRSHTGSKPMSIELELDHPIPARLLSTTRRLAVG